MGRRSRTTALTAALAALVVLLLPACTTGPDERGRPDRSDRPGEEREPRPSDAPVELFVAPRGECDPESRSAEPGEAVCDLRDAHRVLSRLRDDGRARGDITVRFAPGRYDMGTYYWRTWAEPGHTLRFVPDWWEPGLDEPAGPLPEFRGGSSADHWLSVVRDEDDPEPVGAVEIADLRVRDYSNGIMVNGGLTLGNLDGRARGVDPPAPRVTVDHVVMENIGNRGDGSQVRGESALGLRNIAAGEVRDSRFEYVANGEDDEEYAHAIYAMDSREITISGNTFTRTSGDPIRLRNNNQDFVVSGNVFERSGSRAAVSDWYVDRESAEERDQPWETRSEEPTMRGNEFVGGTYHGADVLSWRPFEGGEEDQ